jgi:hypothetical protein
MKKDIQVPKVEHIAVAIVPTDDNPNAEVWEVYLINYKDLPINNIIVNARGYGEIEGEQRKTSNLRYFIESLDAGNFVMVEPIQRALFELANEFWISFELNGKLLDKKYVFVSGSIHENHLVSVPILARQGVMIV